jgi:hypothetical protein
MYKTFRVNYSVGKTDGMGFTPGSRTYLLETVVTAIDAGQARAMVEAQNGGEKNCRVNSVMPING